MSVTPGDRADGMRARRPGSSPPSAVRRRRRRAVDAELERAHRVSLRSGAGFGRTAIPSAATPQPTRRARRGTRSGRRRARRGGRCVAKHRRTRACGPPTSGLEGVDVAGHEPRRRARSKAGSDGELGDERSPRERAAERRAADHGRRVDDVGARRRRATSAQRTPRGGHRAEAGARPSGRGRAARAGGASAVVSTSTPMAAGAQPRLRAPARGSPGRRRQAARSRRRAETFTRRASVHERAAVETDELERPEDREDG